MKMDWKIKMAHAIESILNEDLKHDFYLFKVISESKWELYYKSKKFISGETMDNLASHWKKYVLDIIKCVYESKIRVYFYEQSTKASTKDA